MSATPPSPTVGQVFVPGGLPRLTYNPRESLRLEERVREYLDERHKILSLSGPTKSGKTVLLKTVLPPAVWVSGGSVEVHDDFWEALADGLAIYTAEEPRHRRLRRSARTLGSALS